MFGQTVRRASALQLIAPGLILVIRIPHGLGSPVHSTHASANQVSFMGEGFG